MSRKNERKPKANGKGKKNQKENKAKKPVTGKTVTGNNKRSGQAIPPAKRTVPKLRQNKAQSNARKKKQEEKEARKNGTPAPKKETTATKKTQPTKQKKEYETPLILRPVRVKKHKDNNDGHHHIIVEDFEDKHVSVGLTTKNKKGRNATNYQCEVNPLGGKQTSYMRRQGTVAPQSEYDSKEQVGKLTLKDYDRAQEYGERAKQKYLEKMAQKKGSDVPNTH